MPKQKIDPESGQPVVDAAGNPVMEDGPTVPFDDVKDLVASFKEVVAKMADRPVVAPVAAPAPVDRSAIQKAALDEYNTAREEANTLFAENKGAEATEKLYSAFVKLQGATGIPADQAPGTKALIANAKRVSRADNKDLFDRYSAEIEARMAERPVEDRISPDAWDAAARDIRASHFDDLMEEERAKLRKEFEDKSKETGAPGFRTPVASGAGRARAVPAGVSVDDLDDDQLQAAEFIGLSPEQYAERLDKYQKAMVRPGRVNLLDEEVKHRTKIAPGRF